MGSYYSKLWNDTEDSAQPSTLTPLSVRRPSRRLLSLANLDPRSPSSEITRTPIQIESSQPETPVLDCCEGDPRSPTRTFQRTPIPFEKLLPEDSRQRQQQVIETSVRKTSLHQSRTAPQKTEISKGEQACMAAPGTPPLAQKNVSRKNDSPFGTARSPLKATTHPNRLLQSLQKQQIQRQKNADPYRGKIVASDKENSFVSTAEA